MKEEIKSASIPTTIGYGVASEEGEIVLARVMQGACTVTDFEVNNNLNLESSLSWQVRKLNETVISSSDLPLRWMIIPQGNGTTIALCAPENAPPAEDYYLLFRTNDNQVGRVFFYTIVAPTNTIYDCAPVNLEAPDLVSVSNSTITVSIPIRAADAVVMRLYHSPQMDTPINQWVEIDKPFYGGETFTVTNLTEEKEYYFHIRAYNEGGSGISLPLRVKTLANPPVEPLIFEDITDNSFSVLWPAFTNGLIRYELELKNVDTNSTYTIERIALNPSSEPRVVNKTQSTKYTGILYAVYPGNVREQGMPVNVITKTSIPNSPILTSIMPTTLNVQAPQWRIGWKRLDLMIRQGNAWSVYDIETSSQSMSITGLLPATEYAFKWVAWGQYNFRESAISVVTTPSKNTVVSITPDKPGVVSTTNIGTTSVKVTAPTMRPNATHMKIFYTSNGSNENYTSWLALGGNLTGGEVQNLTGLLPNTYYWFVVVAYNAKGNNFGDVLSRKTLLTGSVDTTLGVPPVPELSLIGNLKIMIKAPSLETWPLNASSLTLEAREKVEDNIEPNTGEWIILKEKVGIGDVLTFNDETIKSCMSYDFRWVSIP